MVGSLACFVPVLSKVRLGPGFAKHSIGFSHPETAKRQTHLDTKKVKHWGRTWGRPAGMPVLFPNVSIQCCTPEKRGDTKNQQTPHANNSHQTSSVSSPKRG